MQGVVEQHTYIHLSHDILEDVKKSVSAGSVPSFNHQVAELASTIHPAHVCKELQEILRLSRFLSALFASDTSVLPLYQRIKNMLAQPDFMKCGRP